ncbi:MAG: phosphoribosylformylglycinamidine synthase subunit PurQ [Rhodospirillales bacterium]|nr:phosphoribosylformylglycinamidine synthase subunit PurQ [Rhodospirillales bacterium]MSP79882.1 phosphoribosylformylglycinamidine synthase subunit PurQ [Rhodospirillales bacterium]
MHAAVVVFPGSNCDRDVEVALARSIGRAPLRVWHRDPGFPKVDLIVLPGGFSYGDYLRSGAMAARSPVMGEVIRRANQGVPVLGICNGFQVLTETGLLPGALMRNAGLKFICRDVHLKVETAASAFTGGYAKSQVVRFPVAHHDGNYFADAGTLKRLEDEDRVAFRYCDPQGRVTAETNVNGSLGNIAGILSEKRNVLGLMPHPERLADPELGGTDGRAMFDHFVRVLH